MNDDNCCGCQCGNNGCVCQACKMPMKREDDFGTEADGSQNCDYCIHCYKNGVLITEDDKA